MHPESFLDAFFIYRGLYEIFNVFYYFDRLNNESRVFSLRRRRIAE